MYSMYERYFAAALSQPSTGRPTQVRLRQFYIDREFDRFPLAHATVRRLPGNDAEVWHDWLSGRRSGNARVRAIGCSRTPAPERRRGRRDTLERTVATRLRRARIQVGRAKQLSVRDTARATVGSATFAVKQPATCPRRQTARRRRAVRLRVAHGAGRRSSTTSVPITLAGLVVPGRDVQRLDRAAGSGRRT